MISEVNLVATKIWEPVKHSVEHSSVKNRIIIVLSLPLVNVDYFYFIISVGISICSQYIFHLFIYHIFCCLALISYIFCKYELGDLMPN